MEGIPENLLSKVKNPVLYGLLMFMMSGGMQYFEPVIDHWTGQDEDQIELIYSLIDQERDHRDSLWQHGVDRMVALDTGLNHVKAFLELKSKTEGNSTFAIGLRGQHGTDSLWYRAANGKIYDAKYEPAVMWWLYKDGFDNKAVLFEMDWEIFCMVQNAMTGQ